MEILVHLAPVRYILYVSLQSFMSCGRIDQNILFHFLLIISHKSPTVAKALPSSVFDPNIRSPIAIAIVTQLLYSYRR